MNMSISSEILQINQEIKKSCWTARPDAVFRNEKNLLPAIFWIKTNTKNACLSCLFWCQHSNFLRPASKQIRKTHVSRTVCMPLQVIIYKQPSERLAPLGINIVGSQLKISLPATEFDNLRINIELHSRTIKSVYSVHEICPWKYWIAVHGTA